MYEATSDLFNLPPQEVEIIVDLLESRTWDVLLHLQERDITNPAYGILQRSEDLHDMLRAQGTLKAFRDLDGTMPGIYESAKAE